MPHSCSSCSPVDPADGILAHVVSPSQPSGRLGAVSMTKGALLLPEIVLCEVRIFALLSGGVAKAGRIGRRTRNFST